MQRRFTGLVLGCLASLAFISLSFAHESWLQPVHFFVEQPGPQVVKLTSGMGEHYAKPGTAVEASRVVRSGVFFDRRKLALTAGDTAGGSLDLSWTPPGPGVATLWVELAPKVLLLPDSLITEYFDEIGASPALRKQWTDAPPKQWRESYAKFAKTYVRVGSATASAGFTGAVGLKLEIVPDRDPTSLRVGDRLGLRVLYQGKPLPAFTIAVFREGGSKPSFVKTDAKGLTMIRLDNPGGVLLAGVNLRRVHEASLEWRSDFTSMTFPVRAR